MTLRTDASTFTACMNLQIGGILKVELGLQFFKEKQEEIG